MEDDLADFAIRDQRWLLWQRLPASGIQLPARIQVFGSPFVIAPAIKHRILDPPEEDLN